VTPTLVALSQSKLDNAITALKAGNCAKASHEALSSAHLMPPRPTPYQILGFCDSRAGKDELAVKLLETAVSHDPRAWQSYYGLALVKAAAGQDPRAAAREAFRLAPQEPLAMTAKELFTRGDRQKWERRARNARLPIY